MTKHTLCSRESAFNVCVSFVHLPTRTRCPVLCIRIRIRVISGTVDISALKRPLAIIVFCNTAMASNTFLGSTVSLLLLWFAAVHGQHIYEPDSDAPSSQRDIERRCMRELPHPDDTIVHLIEYRNVNFSDPDVAFFPAEAYTPNENDFTELTCPWEPDENAIVTDISRDVIFIFESQMCHDVLFYLEDDHPVVCLYLTGEAEVEVTVPLVPAITTLVLASISVLASLLLLITHIIFPSLRTLPSKVVMNLAVAFLAGDLTVIIQTAVVLEQKQLSDEVAIVSVISFYFFYARFVWMSLSGFEMSRTIHVGTQLRFDSEGKRRRIFLAYLLFGWTIPLVPTSIMAIVHFEDLEGKDIGEGSLFGIGGYIITMLPVGITILFNVAIFCYLTYVLYQARKWQVKVTDALLAQRRKTNFTRIFIIIISILGLSWFLLFLLFIDGVSTNTALLVVYSVFNVSQPIFVCIAFIGTKKIFRKYFSLCTESPEEDTETSRFRNRRLLSFLFTDKELSKQIPKYRYKHQYRSDSKVSTTSVTMLSRDSSNSISTQPQKNGSCSPPNGLAPITEEAEVEHVVDDIDTKDESPAHVAVDIKDSTV